MVKTGVYVLCIRETSVSSVKEKQAVEKEVIILAERVIDGLGRHRGHRLRKEEGCFHK